MYQIYEQKLELDRGPEFDAERNDAEDSARYLRPWNKNLIIYLIKKYLKLGNQVNNLNLTKPPTGIDVFAINGELSGFFLHFAISSGKVKFSCRIEVGSFEL